jgi:CelD/BcsL family acetyltransferase involved in cellulose biosynthesis
MSARRAEIYSHRQSTRDSEYSICAAAGPDGLEQIRGEWDALADELGAPPFLRPGWIAAWWRAFGDGRLEVLAARRAGDLVAVLPVVHRRGTTSSPSNWHTPTFGPLYAESSSAAAILEELFARQSHLVSISFLSSVEPHLHELRAAAKKAGYRVSVRLLQRSPAVVVREDWSAFERSLSRNLRGDLGRCRRRLDELGSVTIEVTEGPAGLDARLAEAFALERSGWKDRRRTAIASRPETASFYTEIARWAARRGSLRLIFLRLSDRPIAFHLALEDGGVYFPLKGGFDAAFGAYSPGKLIIRATLERAFAVGLERYEFLGDNDDYKRRWATAECERMLFQAFAPSLLGRANRAAFVYGRPLAKSALQTLRLRPGSHAVNKVGPNRGRR